MYARQIIDNIIFLILFIGYLLFSVTVVGAEQFAPITVNDFSGGLNTEVSNPRLMPKNQSNDCYNMHLLKYGQMKPRSGYRAVTSLLANYSKIWGIHSHKFTDGRGVLFQLLKRSDTDWCDLYISDIFSYSADDSLGSYLFPRTPLWVDWIENVFLFDGINVPKIIVDAPDNPRMLDIMPRAPGEIEIVVTNTDGNPFGEFIYAIAAKSSALSGQNYYNVTYYNNYPIFADSQKVMIKGLSRWHLRTWGDSTDLYLLKTRVGHVNLRTDSFFVCDSAKSQTLAEIESYMFVDNHNGNFTPGDDFFRTIRECQANNPIPSSAVLGCPRYIEFDTGSPGPYIIDNSNYSNIRYLLIFHDTLTNVYSDTSLNYKVSSTDTVWSGGSNTLSFTLWVPGAPDSRYVKIIYKASYNKTAGAWTDYYILDTIPSADTLFIDSLHMDTLIIYNSALSITGKLYRWKGAVIHDDRMFAWDNHNVYMSETGSSGQWLPDQIISFEMDDGDRIIGLESKEGGVLVRKTKAIYFIYTNDGHATHLTKKSSGVGMISPQSISNYNGASFFLGSKGINIETGNQYQENSFVRSKISDNIKSIVIRTADSMVNAASIIHGDKMLFSYPGTDSSYVYFFDAGGWSVWSFDFLQGILYDTLYRKDYTPFDELIFIKDDDERIFLWHDSITTDTNQPFSASWEKEFAFPTLEMVTPEILHLWKDANVDDTVTVVVTITNEESDTLFQGSIDSLNYVHSYLFLGNDTLSHVGNRLTVNLQMNNEDIIIEELNLITGPAGIDKRRY